MSVLTSIKFFSPTSDSSYLIYEIIRIIAGRNNSDKKTLLIWTPSHNGIVGNEHVNCDTHKGVYYFDNFYSRTMIPWFKKNQSY